MTVSVIYGLIDGGTLELRYVGKTTHPIENRLRGHKAGKGPNKHLNRWLASTPVNVIVLERDPADLDEAEVRWIREMRERGARLLNILAGGQGWTRGRKFTPEHRAKISVALRGHVYPKQTVEHRAKISAALKGNKNALGYQATPETRAKLRAALLGHSCSLETRAKISVKAKLRGNNGNSRKRAKNLTDSQEEEARAAWFESKRRKEAARMATERTNQTGEVN